MEIENFVFTNRSWTTGPRFSYHPPPYALNYAGWTDILYQSLPTPSDDTFQMQQLRFPTPPITPPHRTIGTLDDYAPQKRTQSVIMKIKNGEGPQYIPTNVSYASSDELKFASHDATSSGASSPTSNDVFCDWINCGRYFETLESLATHVTQIHAIASLADGLYYCRWSGCLRTDRGFNARYKMLVHVRTHTKEKPHQCHLCEKSFSRAENLKIHIRSHSGEKPYICTFEGCNKAYSNSSDRFKHTRTHSMEKPYMCKVPGCQKRYTDPSSLRKHVKTFKHTVQLMNSPKAESSQAPGGGSLEELHKNVQPYIDQGTPRSVYFLVEPTHSEHFCVTADEMCSMKNHSRHECYPIPTSESYWSHHNISHATEDAYFNSCVWHRNDCSMDVGLDKPLDLRVNRS